MSASFPMQCVGVLVETPAVSVFSFLTPSGHDDLPCVVMPGAHVELTLPDEQGLEQKRLYSVIQRSGNSGFDIAVQKTGRAGFADQLHAQLRQGVVVPVRCLPAEFSVDSLRHCAHVVMLAGGIGITLPLALLRQLSALHQQRQSVPRVTLLLSVRTLQEVPFLRELLALDLLSAWFDLRIFVTQDVLIKPRAHFYSGRLTAERLQELPAPEAVVICGSHAFATGVQKCARQAYADARIFVEAYSPPVVSTTPDTTQGQSPLEPLELFVQGFPQVLSASPAKSVLEHLEAAGIAIRTQCRSGICGSCRIQIVSGEFRREEDFALSPREIDEGIALACCTFPTTGRLSISLP